MARNLLTEEELVSRLNQELRKHGECDDCKFEHVRKLTGLDSEGCNWAEPNLRCSGVPADVCVPSAKQVIREARAIYNLK